MEPSIELVQPHRDVVLSDSSCELVELPEFPTTKKIYSSEKENTLKWWSTACIGSAKRLLADPQTRNRYFIEFYNLEQVINSYRAEYKKFCEDVGLDRPWTDGITDLFFENEPSEGTKKLKKNSVKFYKKKKIKLFFNYFFTLKIRITFC